ncbi:predicted protein [Phaeodactylum tricornutum CCAP 1055/1]|jgi:hypothetical protein|uniref:Uncharacterized protein n=1 Tax=Phaeodactylum tricornutum (strain CCAP 1055/1) TaxID=556484 RepID=B7G0M1_PHATC|nr:predicted protein [Phaeodactylum tricornutum CCAP 1055/1]EEC48112.1 predicted protein [Phaeodactylum tricornutum CCAP 1055/1]|eukprot:XP_002180704.1 predicted protein [Phaeodactylum tricornutum CCAP 1055/1]
MKVALALVTAYSIAVVTDAAITFSDLEAGTTNGSSEPSDEQRLRPFSRKNSGHGRTLKNKKSNETPSGSGGKGDTFPVGSEPPSPSPKSGGERPAALPPYSTGSGKSKRKQPEESRSMKKSDKLKIESSTSSKSGKGSGSGKRSGSSKADSSQGKGKGKGKGGGVETAAPIGCASDVAQTILSQVNEVITRNPERCCSFDGPTAVFVTHALADSSTISGFEPFWDNIYGGIESASDSAGTCFVMTGYDSQATPTRDLADILVEVNLVASTIGGVSAMMSTDPSEDVSLIQTIRGIASNPVLPHIGIFNTGYNNVIIEAIVTGFARLPYIGYLQDSDYGKEAGRITLQLLSGTNATPLCFNARPDLTFINDRCATYYNEVTDSSVIPPTGVQCNTASTVDGIVSKIVDANANAVWSHVDCCSAVADAVARVRSMGKSVIAGCMDMDTSGGKVNFITTQPVDLQAFQASTWVNFPLLQEMDGNDGRGVQYFPSLQSLVNTAVFNIVNL